MKTALSMLALGLSLLGPLVLGGCAGLPELVPLGPGPERAALIQRCQRLHPRTAFRAVHTIEANLPMDQTSSVIGASLVDPAGARFRAVLMSVEGLTLFDAARVGDDLTVFKALPPLDDPDFGPGLMADVALALLAPAGAPSAAGRLPDGRPACRHTSSDGGAVDLLPAEGDLPGRLDRYGPDEDLVRRVNLYAPTGPLGLAARILLTAPGLIGYRLELTLLEASPVTLDDALFSP